MVGTSHRLSAVFQNNSNLPRNVAFLHVAFAARIFAVLGVLNINLFFLTHSLFTASLINKSIRLYSARFLIFLFVFFSFMIIPKLFKLSKSGIIYKFKSGMRCEFINCSFYLDTLCEE